eukprot:GHVS01091165.1.p1 GENE.GHVS01091165.1~~GHVS01091165.1.p1  ORF type:complete len:390 (+),score=106.76 GHVS01091165.1:47-1216(+)
MKWLFAVLVVTTCCSSGDGGRLLTWVPPQYPPHPSASRPPHPSPFSVLFAKLPYDPRRDYLPDLSPPVKFSTTELIKPSRAITPRHIDQTPTLPPNYNPPPTQHTLPPPPTPPPPPTQPPPPPPDPSQPPPANHRQQPPPSAPLPSAHLFIQPQVPPSPALIEQLVADAAGLPTAAAEQPYQVVMSEELLQNVLEGRGAHMPRFGEKMMMRKKDQPGAPRGSLGGPPPLNALLPEMDRSYEVLVNFVPEMEIVECKQIVANYVKQVREWGGKLIDCTYNGRKALRKMVKRRRHARQCVLTVRLLPSAVRYLHKRMTLDDLILRFRILKPSPELVKLQKKWNRRVDYAAKQGRILDPPPVLGIAAQRVLRRPPPSPPICSTTSSSFADLL